MHQKLSYLQGIDGLRALSIMLVIFHHAYFPFFSGGFIGVDLFFVISGFLITHIIVDELHEKQSFSFTHFYLRRIKRLIPAILFLMVFIIPLWAIFCSGIPPETNHFVESISYSLLGLGNIFFLYNTFDYFNVVSSHRPLLHFWSLGVEEQFYLLWPFVLFITHKVLGLKNIPRVILLLLLLSFLRCLYLVSLKTSWGFYPMPTRAWELAAGGLLVFIIPHLKKGSSWFWQALSLVSLGTILYCNFYFHKDMIFPGWKALPPVLGAMGLIISLTQTQRGLNRLFHQRLVVRVGLISYGLYLWHWPLFSMLRINRAESVHGLILLIALSFLMSEISFRFIESPVRFGTWIKKFKPSSIMLMALASLLSIIASSRSLLVVDRMVQSESLAFYEAMEGGHPFKRECHGRIRMIGTKACMRTFSENPAIHFFLWGNSHAVPYAEFFELMAQDYQGKLIFASASKYLGFLTDRPALNDKEQAARDIHQKMFDLIENQKGRKVVILANGFYAPFGVNGVPSTFEIERTIQKLVNLSVERIIIPLPSVVFRKEPRECLVQEIDCSIERREVERERTEIVLFFRELARKYPTIDLLDPLPILCPEELCQLKLNDIPINEDREHMSGAASRYLYQEIKRRTKAATSH